jgi:hypothetical protein
MHRLKSMSGLRCPGMLLTMLIVPVILMGAQPRLQSKASSTATMLTLTVAGMQLPALKRISLTFVYNPSGVNAVRALVSSPVPSTALGAVLDTASRKLIINIIAQSSVTMSDGLSLLVISAPLVQSLVSGQALTLASATGIDLNGAAFVPVIDPTSISSPLRRSTIAPCQTRPHTSMVLANGRACGTTAAAGLRISSDGANIVLHNTMPAQRRH